MGRVAPLAAVAAALVLAGCLGAGPDLGTAGDPGAGGDGDGHEHDDDHGYDGDRRDAGRVSTHRIGPQPPGTEEKLSLDHGPYLVGPGQDHNRLRIHVPADGGFVTEIGARLVDPATGQAPSHTDLHLHHGVALRAEDDPTDPQGEWPLVEWYWATGGERGRRNLTAVADAAPDGPRYGVHLEGGDPQLVDFMLANRQPEPQTVLARVEITFVHGSAEEIEAAGDCQGAPEDARCRAGQTFHELAPRLWGGFPFDVPRQADGPGTYVWPPDDPRGDAWTDPTTGEVAGAPWDGAIVYGGGHVHRNGKQVVVANLGPPGSGCSADVDGDGWPGVTLYRSRATAEPAKAWPHTHPAQMTATQPSWRAPVHEGDRITLWGTYENRDQAEPDAMAIAGLLADPAAEPPPADHADGCDADALAPYLVGDAHAEPGYTIRTREGSHDHGTVCNREGLGADLPDEPACNREVRGEPERVATSTIQIQGFDFVPGGLRAPGPADRIPVVEQGQTLTWVNEDVTLGVRHTVTSCRWPCNGPSTQNYPQPSGAFESGKIGNFDPADEGMNGPEDLPVWRLDTSDLEPGLHAYHDRIHPWMRGWFEVVEPGAGLR